jgi:hypothetical protein
MSQILLLRAILVRQIVILVSLLIIVRRGGRCAVFGVRFRRLLTAMIVGALAALVPVLVPVSPAAAEQVERIPTASEQTFTVPAAIPQMTGLASEDRYVFGVTARTRPAAGRSDLVTPSAAAAATAGPGTELALTGENVGGIALSAFIAMIIGIALLLSVRHHRVAATAITDDQPGASEILDQLLDEDQAE